MTEDVVKKLLEWAKGIEDIAGEQVPLLVEEIIMWGIVSNLAQIIIAGVVAGFGLSIAFKSLGNHRKAKKANKWSEDYIPAIAISFGAAAIGSVIAVIGVFETLQAVFAPRVYLIDYLSRLISD